jgi:hypothetical protein
MATTRQKDGMWEVPDTRALWGPAPGVRPDHRLRTCMSGGPMSATPPGRVALYTFVNSPERSFSFLTPAESAPRRSSDFPESRRASWRVSNASMGVDANTYSDEHSVVCKRTWFLPSHLVHGSHLLHRSPQSTRVRIPPLHARAWYVKTCTHPVITR